jgi:molybdate transport system ATP-binding protein
MKSLRPTLHLSNVCLPLAAFSLEVADAALQGRVTAIFGASGSGKTMLLEIVAGLRRPRRARVQLGERVLADTSAGIWVPPERRHVGYVPQDGALFPHLSVRANLLYGHGGNRSHVEQTAFGRPGFSLEPIVEILEIGPLLDRPSVGSLSGGERQRVALARALLAGPELLLLDEPLAGMDAALKARVLPYLVRVRDEFAAPMLFVSHAPEEVMALCDEMIVLDRGRIVNQGAPADLFMPDQKPSYILKTSLH